MKNIGRMIAIAFLAGVCMVGIILLSKGVRKEQIAGITHQEMRVLWEALPECKWTANENEAKEVTWGEVLHALDTMRDKNAWQKVWQQSHNDVYKSVQKMNQRYHTQDKVLRDDWYGFYQILCAFLLSELDCPVKVAEVVMLDKIDDTTWVTNEGSLGNQSDFPFKEYHNYWVVHDGASIIAAWKESSEAIRISNAFIELANEERLSFFYHNQLIHIEPTGIGEALQKVGKYLGNTENESTKGKVGDICFAGGKVKEIHILNDVISGKILQRTDTLLVLDKEENAQYEFEQDVEVYRTYADLKTLTPEDIPIGYEYADLVLQDGKIAAVLLTRDKSMETIRVLLKNTAKEDFFYDSFEVTSDTTFRVERKSEEIVFQQGETYRITPKDMELGERIVIRTDAHSGTIRCETIKRSQGTPAYRGSIEILALKEGLIAINEVLLEEYLYTVVPSEMPASYPMEALKAQAICARTYAYNKMLHALYPQWGAHLDDTTTCQVYHNQEEHANTNQAVRDTFGEVAMQGDTLIDTFYYSTSCGFGTTEEIWGNGKKYEYLQSVAIRAQQQEGESLAMCREEGFREFIRMGNEEDYECEEPWYRWSYHEKVDKNAFWSRLQKCYQQAPDKVLVWSESKQQYLSQELPTLEALQAIKITQRLSGGIAQEMEILAGKYRIKVKTEQMIRTILPEPDSTIMRWDGSSVKMSGILPSAFLYINTEQNDKKEITELYIAGGGYGHGVGMSQNAAAHMAKEGMRAQDILAFFYKGIEIGNLY